MATMRIFGIIVNWFWIFFSQPVGEMGNRDWGKNLKKREKFGRTVEI
jgi:hypothetical protein